MIKKILIILLIPSIVWATDYSQHANCDILYTFNETSGTIDDKCNGGSNDGTVTDATPTTFYSQTPSQNNLFTSVLFDGSIDLVTFTSSVDPGTTHTIVFWIKDNTFAGDYGAIFTDATTSGAGLYIRGSGGVDDGELTYWDGTSDHDSVTTFDDGAWHFVMVVVTAGVLDFWDDCTNINNNLTFASTSVTYDRMGTDNASSDIDNTFIDDFGFFNGIAFDQTECNEIMAKTLKPRRII